MGPFAVVAVAVAAAVAVAGTGPFAAVVVHAESVAVVELIEEAYCPYSTYFPSPSLTSGPYLEPPF